MTHFEILLGLRIYYAPHGPRRLRPVSTLTPSSRRSRYALRIVILSYFCTRPYDGDQGALGRPPQVVAPRTAPGSRCRLRAPPTAWRLS